MNSRTPNVLLLTVLLAMVAAPAGAATLNVPGDHATVTAAVAAANSGDTIEVAAGNYSEPEISYLSKDLVIRGAGAGTTILDSNDGGVLFIAASTSTIEGFTITGGSRSSGGGVNINGGTVTIRGCLIRDNVATNDGGGVDTINSPSVTIDHCTFSNNTAASGGAIHGGSSGTSITVKSSILWGNTPDEISGFGTVVIDHSNVQGSNGVAPNLDTDPLFTDAENDDFTLACTSPCVGAGVGGSDMGAFPAAGGGGPVTVSGTVTSSCDVNLTGVMVDLLVGPNDTFYTTSTDTNGAYTFTDVEVACGGPPDSGDVSILVPLGYRADVPVNGEAVILLDEDKTQDFSVLCLDPSGVARSKGYWKHQASVHLNDRGHAHESEDDMVTNFPNAIFDHFHENSLNSIAVEGVTHVTDSTNTAVPLDLDTIQDTLKKKGSQENKAKQQYLALLLNMASGKVLTSTIASVDGATASQAIQYIADLLNDGDGSNDELAKDIAETLNHASLVGAGVIPLTYTDISYARRQLSQQPLRVFPNPGSASRDYVFSFGIPSTGEAALEIYDVSGRRVAAPMTGVMEAGRRELRWNGRTLDGRRVAQGVYFARLATADGAKSVKFVHIAR